MHGERPKDYSIKTYNLFISNSLCIVTSSDFEGSPGDYPKIRSRLRWLYSIFSCGVILVKSGSSSSTIRGREETGRAAAAGVGAAGTGLGTAGLGGGGEAGTVIVERPL
jgi:hypothetical protein